MSCRQGALTKLYGVVRCRFQAPIKSVSCRNVQAPLPAAGMKELQFVHGTTFLSVTCQRQRSFPPSSGSREPDAPHR